MISVSEAHERLLDSAAQISDTEIIPLTQALGRVLAQDLTSSVDVPPADNSSMDGYAARAQDITAGEWYSISHRITAGSRAGELSPGNVARIFTGAEIPSGADCIIIQEQAQTQSQIQAQDQAPQVCFDIEPEFGDNIRRQGQDIRFGSQILAAGTRLRPQEIGLAASCGLAELCVFRQLKVGLLSTGDELVEPGIPLEPGQIYNSNRQMLWTLCLQAGFKPIDFGLVADNPQATQSALREASEKCDLIITTGGVSVGEEDHVRDAVEALGQISLWKVAIKPGKPLAQGTVGNTAFIGLPGNPSSVFTTFLILALPYMRAMQGQLAHQPHLEQLPACFSRNPVRRQEYLRARRSEQGIEIFSNQSSGVLSSACWGDGFVVQAIGDSIIEGEVVSYLPYNSLW